MVKRPALYHVNPNTLRPNQCRRKDCRILDRDGNPVEHFPTRDAALVHAEEWAVKVAEREQQKTTLDPVAEVDENGSPVTSDEKVETVVDADENNPMVESVDQLSDTTGDDHETASASNTETGTESAASIADIHESTNNSSITRTDDNDSMVDDEWNENGEKCYYNEDGQFHRVDGPARVGREGYEYWYVNGCLHRDGDPAIVEAEGSMSWFNHGELHRVDGPAMIHAPSGSEWWYLHGDLHREDGPAVMRPLCGVTEYWFHGVQTTEANLSTLVQWAQENDLEALLPMEQRVKVRELVQTLKD